MADFRVLIGHRTAAQLADRRSVLETGGEMQILGRRQGAI